MKKEQLNQQLNQPGVFTYIAYGEPLSNISSRTTFATAADCIEFFRTQASGEFEVLEIRSVFKGRVQPAVVEL